jgi:hypothetical protein
MIAPPTKVWMRMGRRLGRDGNELRRRSDFIEACLVPAAFALFVIFVPVVAALTTFWVRADNSAVAHAEVTWAKVPGVLLQSVPGPMEADHGANAWMEQARARWTWDGQPRVGYVPAAAGSTDGSPVTVYVDRLGDVQTLPLTTGQVTGRVVEISLAVLTVLAVLLTGLVRLVRHALDRRRIAAWEMAWREFGPIWSRQGPSTATGREA